MENNEKKSELKLLQEDKIEKEKCDELFCNVDVGISLNTIEVE